ncbi:gephyrin-like molybdotransferase Glp [Aquimarina gracilis]|uniref:Molybdopterin molybdenumtransferase n=1 Tax=Aquimarina gracilis TaxID=874422 RepID=A0ABU5ZSM0_9FLAO|nr:gephyrin-like molybdotransferase Glp [Aquimarina gracilis]MEB3345080.1 gephyrin-like molybdotransferase Glp [Aquimarina gracilis]
MVPVEKALQLVDNHIKQTKEITTLSISNAIGFVLAKDVLSPINMPPFRQSAMDGYALGSIEEKTYSLIGEVQAGDDKDPVLKKGEAIRIFTGAPVPAEAKAVIMQEKVEVIDSNILVQESPTLDANIRPAGEQIKEREIALVAGTTITAAAIGYLATLGITDIEVYKKPSIAIIATGNELVPPGQKLKYGQIYESNSVMLSSALTTAGFTTINFHKVEDQYDATRSIIEKAIQEYDVVLISGGISVGDYDFVGKALRDIQVEEIFYKVKQKPGKPLYFAQKDNTTIFALPGNPASSLSCFYIYVLPALQKISGLQQYHLKRSTAISNSDYSKKGERAEFLKALLKDDKVTILDGQASSMLRSFALANVLVYLPEEVSKVKPGDSIQIINLS